MLKALELVGFKSFADKTRFEFPPGVTVVVGPNGSGKSNVVDAIKWVLGEQSVKSLRGKEMADVIFNGSGTRRPMNAAEITLTLENSAGVLPVDTPEVHITRRVYRSGEGEYLVNRQPCRLRDIKDLLAGTGLGSHAYSVIEQGKVDVLLQSSPRERRVIFEEAAGISRFKAKKLEALRRLERVDQNLLRLSDIVDEVENRLRSLRAQASKARRYREYTERLQELRTQVALVDWHRMTDRLKECEDDLAALAEQHDAASAEAGAIEMRLVEAEGRIAEANEAIHHCESRGAATRTRIAAQSSAIEHERKRGQDLDEEISRHRTQLAAMSHRAGDLLQQLRETEKAVAAADEQHVRLARSLAEGERGLTEINDELDQLRSEGEQRRSAYLEQMRSAAALGNETGALERELAATLSLRQRSQQRLEDLDAQLRAVTSERESLLHTRADLGRRVDERSALLGAAKANLAGRRRDLALCEADRANLHQRRSGLAERAALLEELERRYEGVSAGVKEVLNQSRESPDGPFRQVCGLLADLIQVSMEAAMLVEVALGERAQHVVVTPGGELLEHLKGHPNQFSGRVGFVWLDGHRYESEEPPADLSGRPGVLGRADWFVQTDSTYAPLVSRLLCRTWFVETLAHALAYGGSVGRGLSFVTAAGELLAADGTIAVGPRHTATGLITRRSELRSLKIQLADLDSRIAASNAEIESLEQQIAIDEQHADVLAADHQRALDALGEHGHRITAADERLSQVARQRGALEDEVRAAAEKHDAVERQLDAARTRQGLLAASLADAETSVNALVQRIERVEGERLVRQRQATEAKVDLAKSEERLENLRARLRQSEESQQERMRAIGDSRQRLAECIRRSEQSHRIILDAEADLAGLYLQKEGLARQSAEAIARRDELQRERSELAADVQRIRGRMRKLEDRIHSQDLAANEIRHERTTLAARLREDYAIELAELEHEPTLEEQHQREAVQQEIDELRRKINGLGNVNLEALEELDQHEARYQTLAEQYKDLSEAKKALEKIIEKINADSRRLFVDTLETVRGHFQQLFRDLFGGGQADIVLEEGVDILETGIEIVARPPGKEPRSISLLSGGEKTLTCVAMLLAIFRSRPSPFCVLDEVDAALDEANIDRFTKVLQDFLTWTQFIIVTHSKKTMTCANTIYGVTMQESGISKQVSVRFEDVSDDGEIRLPAGSAPAADETQAA